MTENNDSQSSGFQLPCRLMTPRGSGRGTVCYLAFDAVRVTGPVAPLGVGSFVSLEIESAAGNRLSVSGEVRRVVPQGSNAEYSIRLVGLQHAVRAEIGRMLDLATLGPQLSELKHDLSKGRVDFL